MTAIRNNTSPSVADPPDADPKEAIGKWIEAHHPVLEVLLDAYCVVDSTNRVVDFNVAFTDLCGESYRKILKIAEFGELVRMQISPVQEILASLKPARWDEVPATTRAYPQLQLIIGGVPIAGSSGEGIGALLTIRNVSAESELQKKYDERKKESIIDGLTRLYNKVFTEAQLLRAVKTAARDSSPVSIVLCDVDHFKNVNDTYGHPAGDYVLATVAQMLKGESRETDVAGRFGGEEFLVILPSSDVEGARVFAERFRGRVEATRILFEGKHVPLTVSLGTATFSNQWAKGMEPERCAREMVTQSDTALYHAKANGRNKTCQFELLKKKSG